MKNLFYTNTKLIGLLGHPIKQSYSPFIHNVAFQFKNIDYIYLPFDVVTDELEIALKGAVTLGMNGLNVTIPHKVKIIDFLDDLSEESSMIGAVNTITIEQGSLKGYNTDVHGILETLSQFKDEINGEQVTIIGAGGGARASIFTLIRYFKPKEINIINRTLQRAETLQVYFYDKMRYDNIKSAELFPPDLVETFKSSKLIINASPIGMFPAIEDSPTNLDESFHKDQIVFDYARLDLSITYEKQYKSWSIAPYLQIYNIGNRSNVWFAEYEFNNGLPKVQPQYMFPILPTIGVTFTF